MSLHVECGRVRLAGANLQPVEVGSDLHWSETLASAGTTTNAVPGSASPDEAVVVTLTPLVDGWVAIGASPNASANPRRRVLSGQPRSFFVWQGTRVAWLPS